MQHQGGEQTSEDLHLSTADHQKVGFHPWLNIRSARWLRFESAPTWLPFESAQEHHLLDALAGRRFTKGQRYNMPMSRPLASAVLNDTADPTALYLVPADASEAFEKSIGELADGSGLASWWWRAREGEMPVLPPVQALAGG